MSMAMIQGSVSLGLMWAFMALGVYITYRILEMPDLTAEGSIILGAGLASRWVADGIDPIVATTAAAGVGSLAGLVTGILHTKLEIPPILAGILTMVGSYSVALRIMTTSNVSLLHIRTIFSPFQDMGLNNRDAAIVLGGGLVIILIAILYWFFGTELGSAIRATGNNKNMARAIGINIDNMVILGLMISNGIIGLAGALVSQNHGFASVDMGGGTIATGLASVIIAEVLIRARKFWLRLFSVALGAIVYRIIIALVLQMGMHPNDLRLFRALTVAFILTWPIIKRKFNAKFPSLSLAKSSAKEQGGQ